MPQLGGGGGAGGGAGGRLGHLEPRLLARDLFIAVVDVVAVVARDLGGVHGHLADRVVVVQVRQRNWVYWARQDLYYQLQGLLEATIYYTPCRDCRMWVDNVWVGPDRGWT